MVGIPLLSCSSDSPCRFWEKIRIVAQLTKRHAINLACFVSIYKSLLAMLCRMTGGKERPWHPLLAGGVGGYLVFSPDNPVNNQVSLDPYSFADRPTPAPRLSSIYWPGC